MQSFNRVIQYIQEHLFQQPFIDHRSSQTGSDIPGDLHSFALDLVRSQAENFIQNIGEGD